MKKSSRWLRVFLGALGGLLLLTANVLAGRSPLGTGATSLENAHQGKVYCSLVHYIATPYAGEVVEKLVEVGEFVKKDEPLLKVKLPMQVWNSLSASIDMEMSIFDSKVTIAALKKHINDTQTKQKELKELSNQGMATVKSVVELEDQLTLLALQLRQAEQKLESTHTKLGRQRKFLSEKLGQNVRNRVPEVAIVKAPVAGYVVAESSSVDEGAWASGHVFTVAVMDPMVIRIRIYEADVMNVKVGDKAEVILEYDANKVHEATVKSIAWMPVNNAIDAPSYYTVDLNIPNPDAFLREGYMVRVLFPKK